jgi:hypothetical protein
MELPNLVVIVSEERIASIFRVEVTEHVTFYVSVFYFPHGGRANF